MTATDLLTLVRLADGTVVQVLDLGVNFRGLADSVLMPPPAFEAWLNDIRQMPENYTVEEGVAADAVHVYDRSGGTTAVYLPRTIAGVTGMVVEAQGFEYVTEEEEPAPSIQTLISETARQQFTAALGYVMGEDVLPADQIDTIAAATLEEFAQRLGGFIIDPEVVGLQSSRLISNGRPAREIAFADGEHDEQIIQWKDEAGDWHYFEEATA